MAAAASVVVVATALPAYAATSPVATYEMNEAPGATVMVDSSGNGLNGSIGSAVQTGVTAYDGSTGYRWSDVKPNEPPAKPERLVTVPDSDLLDPGTAEYSVTIRYRTTENFGNIIQKGQNKTKGGYFKFQAPKGVLKCLFKGSNGEQRTVSSKVALNDGLWHTVTCLRKATQLSMWVDGVVTSRANGSTGSISNKAPLSIGGKSTCDQITITCDYFEGDIDYVRIAKG